MDSSSSYEKLSDLEKGMPSPPPPSLKPMYRISHMVDEQPAILHGIRMNTEVKVDPGVKCACPAACPTDAAFIQAPVYRHMSTGRNAYKSGLLIVIAFIMLSAMFLIKYDAGVMVAVVALTSLGVFHCVFVVCSHRVGEARSSADGA